jgi:hypothetical protein
MRRLSIILLLCGASLFAFNVFFTPKKILELKSQPRDAAETLLMLKEGMLLTVKSVVTDTAGREWYMITLPKEKLEGFVPAADVEMVGDEEKSKIYLKQSSEESEDKRRRMTELRNHPEWPRRIRSAVHGGAICLKMSKEQLFASWEKPYFETSGFILGLGNVEILFYRKENPVAIVVKNNEVAGWSEKGR